MMKKIKIAFFAEILIDDFDGASRTMYQLLDRIPRDKFEFIFFCGVPPNKDLGFEVITLPTLTPPMNKSYKVVVPYFSKRKMRKALNRFNPDVIHIASPSPLGSFAAQFAQKNNIPVLSIYHTHFITYMKYYFKSIPFLFPYFYKKSVKMTQKFYKNLDLVYVPSDQIIYELKTICGLPGGNMKLWQRGMDQALFNPKQKDKAFLKSITLNDHPTILFISRLVWEKNLKILLELYDLVQAKNLPYNFVVAGDGVARKDAEKAMPTAHFLGMVDHQILAKLYASADVYFFPSDTESFGNVVIEAMASGIPCVVANGGGPKSLIVDGESGFLCPPNDTAYYLDKITKILEDDALKQKMISNALAFTAKLSWQNLAKIYFDDLTLLAVKSKES